MSWLDRIGFGALADGLVDIVAHVHDEVEIGFCSKQRHRLPVVRVPVLARHPGEANLSIGVAWRWRGAHRARRADIATRDKTVEMVRLRREAGNLGSHG